MRGRGAMVAGVLFTAMLFAAPLAAQEPEGPLPGGPPQWEVPASTPRRAPAASAPSTPKAPTASAPVHSSSDITNTPPALPVEQIIQRFAEHEEEFREERDNFTYTQEFVVQTVDDDGRVDGEYRLQSDITFTPSGKRYENITYAPQPTLERVSLSEQDLDDLRNIQPFVLTTADLPKYDIKYVGRERVDEIGTYVFDAAPKVIEKNQRYFQGRIWVDDKDLEIVKTDGKAVPDIRKGSNENLFPRFETYRENIEGRFWFPTYTHADDVLHFRSGDVHLLMTVRYTDYKRFRVTVRIGPSTPVSPPEQPKQ